MRKILGAIYRLMGFCRNYGIMSGIVLFTKFLFGCVNNIKVPGIKYPLSLRPNTSDTPTFYQVFFHGEYCNSLIINELVGGGV
jgi:hypothetical protein